MRNLIPVKVLYFKKDKNGQHIEITSKVMDKIYESFINFQADLLHNYGIKLIISDLFRKYITQYYAHLAKPKWAVPANKSVHQIGGAMDVVYEDMGITRDKFLYMGKGHNWHGIQRESWHVEYNWRLLGFKSLLQAIKYVDNDHK